jgi:glucose-1-phosphate adenylyltransferase
MDRVLTMILAGGSPDALGPLGKHRAKTAVPFGGRYRLIDFSLSNCVNSGLREIFILTQYNPRSLRRHIRLGRPWDLDRSRGGVRVLLPYSGVDRSSWFKGTADALIQNLDIMERSLNRYVLILSGDHVYKMDFRELFHRHVVTGATVTVGTRPLQHGDGRRFGIIETDSGGIVQRFTEKPGRDSGSDTNLGIYLFERDFLIDRLRGLQAEGSTDLVRDLIIPAIGETRFATYRYDGYWEDVGDLSAYYNANMLLLDPGAPIQLDDPAWPIYTRSESSSPAWYGPQADAKRCLAGAGCRIAGRIRDSLLFPNVHIEPGASVEGAILLSGCVVKSGATVHRAILDKLAVVEEGVRFVGDDELLVLEKRGRVTAGVGPVGAVNREAGP